MRMILSLCLIGMGLGGAFAFAEESAQQVYQQGIRAFQENQFDKARDLFWQAYESSPDNVEVLYNLGLSELKLEHIGRTLAAWRKAVHIDPYHSATVSGLQFLREQGKTGSFDAGGPLSRFRSEILSRLSFDVLFALTAIFLGLTGFLLIKYWGRRRTAVLAEAPSPPFPTLGFLLAIFFVLFVGLIGLKTYDFYVTRATVVADSVALRTYPSADSNALFDLSSGYEVIVRHAQGDWAQVTYPGGMTGWVPRDTLFLTSGRNPW